MSKDEKYRTAFNAACERATRLNTDVGLEWNAYQRDYSAMLLPAPDKRYGAELRCEVVRPGTPPMLAPVLEPERYDFQDVSRSTFGTTGRK